MLKTIYEHPECKECIYLGPFEYARAKYDLYYCNQDGMPTVIARYGNHPSAYMSGMGIGAVGPQEAERRAKLLGLSLLSETHVPLKH